MKHCTTSDKQHQWKELQGKDYVPMEDRCLERHCLICGSIEIYSSLADTWVPVGNMSDQFPEERRSIYGC